MVEAITIPCACGHAALWHSDRHNDPSSGMCEHDGSCDCEQFIPASCSEMLEVMRDYWTFDAARRWMNGTLAPFTDS